MMDIHVATCPECGGPATLLQVRHESEEIPDLSDPAEKKHLQVKIEEFRCQDPSCEHEFERIVRESNE
jgi:hypothetical protein